MVMAGSIGSERRGKERSEEPVHTWGRSQATKDKGRGRHGAHMSHMRQTWHQKWTCEEKIG